MMWKRTGLTKKLSIGCPIIQAGMAGGHTTPALVTAVCKAEGLGTIGAGYMKPDELKKAIHEVKEGTDRSFAVNLFIPNSSASTDKGLQETKRILGPIAEKLNISLPEPVNLEKLFDQQFEVILQEEVPVFSFTFGIPSQYVIDTCKKQRITMIGTAMNVDEGLALEKAGIDCVVAQGYEAGGHQGAFLDTTDSGGGIGTMALVSQMVEFLSIPVIAAGGIMNGKAILSSLALGAEAVQMGTAFLTSEESGTDALHKKAIIDAIETETQLTRVFTGKWARGIKNDMMRQLQAHTESLAPYPITNQLTQPIRKKAKTLKNKEYMSLWAGQGLRLSETKTASDLMKQWVQEADRQLFHLTGD